MTGFKVAVAGAVIGLLAAIVGILGATYHADQQRLCVERAAAKAQIEASTLAQAGGTLDGAANAKLAADQLNRVNNC